MIVVIQCAASKRPGAGHLVSKTGRPVAFVAHPELAQVGDRYLYARPDDRSETDRAKRIVFYNSIHAPQASGCSLVKYGTDRTTNWHYECADAFLEGAIRMP